MQIKMGVREWYQNQWRCISSSPNQWWSSHLAPWKWCIQIVIVKHGTHSPQGTSTLTW